MYESICWIIGSSWQILFMFYETHEFDYKGYEYRDDAEESNNSLLLTFLDCRIFNVYNLECVKD